MMLKILARAIKQDLGGGGGGCEAEQHKMLVLLQGRPPESDPEPTQCKEKINSSKHPLTLLKCAVPSSQGK